MIRKRQSGDMKEALRYKSPEHELISGSTTQIPRGRRNGPAARFYSQDDSDTHRETPIADLIQKIPFQSSNGGVSNEIFAKLPPCRSWLVPCRQLRARPFRRTRCAIDATLPRRAPGDVNLTDLVYDAARHRRELMRATRFAPLHRSVLLRSLLLLAAASAFRVPDAVSAQQTQPFALSSLRALPPTAGTCEKTTLDSTTKVRAITFLVGTAPDPNRRIRIDVDRSGTVIRFAEMAARLIDDRAIIESVGAAFPSDNRVSGFYRRASGSLAGVDSASTRPLTENEQASVRALAAWVQDRCTKASQ